MIARPLLALAALVLLSPAPALAQAGCRPEQVASLVLQLFPPSPDGVRAEMARRLSRCRSPSTVGALAAVLDHDPELAVRIEAASALALIDSEAGRDRLRAAMGPDRPPALRRHTAATLLAVKDLPSARALLEDRTAPDDLRSDALVVLARAGQGPQETGLVELATRAGPALTATITRLRAERTSATRTSAPPAPQPEPEPEPVTAAAATARVLGPRSSVPGSDQASLPPALTLTEPLAPPPPARPADGTPLAITTSILAGSLWGGSLSLLAQQESVGVVTLLGTAGAVIGGGTAWGLTRFGLRQSPAQALWFTNTTAWGSLAGLMAWAGSGTESTKLKYGLLVGGETLGMAAGIWSARRYHWTTGQVAMANSLALGGALGLVGVQRWRQPTDPLEVSPAAGYGTAPLMLASAVAARYLEPSARDLHLASVGALGAAWTTGLVGSGLAGTSLLEERHGQGGAMAGLGLGYLVATATGAITEVPVGRTYASAAGLLGGNLLGRGLHMMIEPGDEARWKLGTGLGGLGLGVATFAAYHHLAPGPRAASMTLSGILYGVIPWSIAVEDRATTTAEEARFTGGRLALGTAGAVAGYLAAKHFQPDLVDQATTMATTALGLTAGAGITRLASEDRRADIAGVMGGAATGLAAGAVLTHYTRLRGTDVGGGVVGGGYGLLLGTLVPTLQHPAWRDERPTHGGRWLGLSAGAVAGAGLARALDASAGQIVVPAVAGLFGLGAGAGVGLMWPLAGTQSTRVGATAGPIAFMTVAMLAERPLRLSEGLGPSAGGLALAGTTVGAAYGWLVSAVVAPEVHWSLPERQRWGGVLAGASAGAAAGLVLSKRFTPSGTDYLTTVGTGALGTSLGAGLSGLLFPGAGTPGDRHNEAMALGGATLGLAGGAVIARATRLRAPDFGAGVVGAGYGTLFGSLAPTLHRRVWDDDRLTAGGARLGLALGGLGAAAAAHLTEASGGQVAVVSTGTGLGLLAGFGAGLLPAGPPSRPARIGAVAGGLSFAALSVIADRPLRLHEGLGPSAGGLAMAGTTLGLANGLLLSGVYRPEDGAAQPNARQRLGGALAGTTVGLTSGLVLSKLVAPTPTDLLVAGGGSLLGGTLARGIAVTTAESAQTRAAATLAGSLAGLGAAAAVQEWSPLTSEDALALPVGVAFGGLTGALLPSLDEPRLGSGDREEGGLLAGLAGGGLAAMALRHGTGARASTVGWAALGGLDGLATGYGVGLLVDHPDRTQGRRIGAVAGMAAGLTVGSTLWAGSSLDGDDPLAVVAATAVGGWTGAWIPALGHARAGEVPGRTTAGGLLAGAGGASLLAVTLVPRLAIEADLVGDALVMDALLSGAGAGLGALASRRADAPVWGMLGAGTAGLVLGGALHRRLALASADVPLLALATAEGTWYGAWLPHLLHDHPDGRQQAGGLAAGALGTAALATLASPWLKVGGRDASLVGLGSALGASMAGGGALLSSAGSRERTAVLLGGTTVGMVSGALLAPRLQLRERAGWYAVSGAALGATEGLVFAWAGRARGPEERAGAALVGAGVGTTLGLAAAAYPSFTLQRGLASSGFAAWGAWVGAFSGALANRDSHEVTLGGLAGANAGFLAGYGLLRAGWVEPRDFGWLSLAGALGTVAGGGAGAALSSRSDPRPILAGLAIGPAVGMAGGALILPWLRGLSDRPTARLYRAPRVAGMRFELPRRAGASAPVTPETPSLTTPELLARKGPPSLLRRAGHRIEQLAGVASWTPMVGSAAPVPGSTLPAPFILGVAGTLH